MSTGEEKKHEKRIRAYVSEITFNNDEKLSIKENDIVLFVGPNNAGKSQSLNDIYSKCGGSQPTVVIKQIKDTRDDGSLIPLIKAVSKVTYVGIQYNYLLNGGNYGFNKEKGDEDFRRQSNYGQYRDLFVCKLNTENRLSICAPASILNRDQPWTNPIHYTAFDPKNAKWLSENYCKAFGEDLTANSQHGSTIPLCIGPTVRLQQVYDSEIERQAANADILETYKQVHTQGDGIKSFTGILLNLMLDYYCTYLIDEPESFLRPPQARIMGQINGQTLRDNQQAFISTHSEEMVKGLLVVCEDRLKIVRITRDKDKNSFSILDNSRIKEVFGDPLLKYSNIMSSLFHNTVVLCECDSDCKLYSLIESHIKQAEGKYSETLFIHCGGKHRMARIAEALKLLNIDVRLLPDIDILNDENILAEIARVFGIDWDSVKTDFNNIVGNSRSSKERINRNIARAEINRLLDQSQSGELTSKEIKGIQEVIKTESKWSQLKKCGKQALPAGNATTSFDNIDCVFKNNHIYLVRVGELEGFVRQIGGHGPEWVNSVLESYPNLDDPVYKDIKDYVRGIGL